MSNNKGIAITAVKSNGELIQPSIVEAIETVTALDQTIGENLLNTLLDAYHFTPSERSGQGSSEPLASFSKAKLTSIGQAFKDSKTLVSHLENKIKAWRGASSLLTDEWKGEFTAYVLGFAPTEGEMISITPEGVKVTVPIKTGIEDSVSFLFDSLGSLSNAMLLGDMAKTGKNGRAKAAKISIFENVKKGVETGSSDSGGENWGMRASAKYLVNAGIGGEKMCKVVELIGSATKLLNNGQTAGGEKIFRILTGQVREDKRFNLNPSLVKGLIVLRGYGLLISGARQWIKELKDKDSEATKRAAWLNIESTELAEMVSTLERRKVFEENHPELGETNLVDARATLEDVATVHPITIEEKAHRHANKVSDEALANGVITEDERGSYFADAYLLYMDRNAETVETA